VTFDETAPAQHAPAGHHHQATVPSPAPWEQSN
jgi:hypothetical protein